MAALPYYVGRTNCRSKFSWLGWWPPFSFHSLKRSFPHEIDQNIARRAPCRYNLDSSMFNKLYGCYGIQWGPQVSWQRASLCLSNSLDCLGISIVVLSQQLNWIQLIPSTSLPGYKRCLVGLPYTPLLWVLIRITFRDSNKFSLHLVSILLSQSPQFQASLPKMSPSITSPSPDPSLLSLPAHSTSIKSISPIAWRSWIPVYPQLYLTSLVLCIVDNLCLDNSRDCLGIFIGSLWQTTQLGETQSHY